MNTPILENNKWVPIKSYERKQLILTNIVTGFRLMKVFLPSAFILGIVTTILCIFISGFSLQLLAIPFILSLIPCIIFIISLIIIILYFYFLSYYFITTVAENRPDTHKSFKNNYNEAGFYYNGNLIWKRYDAIDTGTFKRGDNIVVLSHKASFSKHFNYVVRPEHLFNA